MFYPKLYSKEKLKDTMHWVVFYFFYVNIYFFFIYLKYIGYVFVGAASMTNDSNLNQYGMTNLILGALMVL